MRSSFLTWIAALLLPWMSSAIADPAQTFAEATEALERGALEEALEGLETLVASEWHAPELYHNLGVLAQRQGKPKRAALELYRAWLLNPFSGDAKRSFLAVAKEAELSETRKRLAVRQATALAWRSPLVVLGLIAFWSGVVLCVLRGPTWTRGMGWTLIGIGVLVSVGSYFVHRETPGTQAAWIIANEPVPLRATHDEGGPRISNLSPLTPVELVRRRGEWSYVRGRSGLSGWLEETQIGRLMPWRS